MKINEIEKQFIVGQKNVAAAKVSFYTFLIGDFHTFNWKPA